MRYYSNSGPLVKEYEERLGALFGCGVVACSSATLGLIASWSTQRELNPYCDAEGVNGTLPSWTFVATANAMRASGITLHFKDVDERTWQSETHATVAPFGLPALDPSWVVDAAASFDAYVTKQGEIGSAPVVISTHATKTFSTGEGGLVLSTDNDVIDLVREFINHGLTHGRQVYRQGSNGKMSEYHAAVGLAELDSWKEKRQRWLETKAMYVEVFDELAHTTPLSSLSWVGSTFCIRIHGKDVREIMPKLIEQGIATRQVWGRGVHRYGAYKNCEHEEDLSVTEKLADEVLFLPFSIDSTRADAEYIHEAVRKLI